MLLLTLAGCLAGLFSDETAQQNARQADSGAGDTAEPGGSRGLTFDDDIAPLLLACTGCHGGENPEGGLEMPADDLYNALVGQPSGQAEMMLIEPGDSLYSYLWHKLNGSQSVAGGAGTSMPLGARWPDEDLQVLADWIDLGCAP